MSNHTDVHVVGGGLGGLTAAALVARTGCSVTVHESRNRLGGRATTDERNGFRFNQGPHALYLGGEGVRVLADLGIAATGKPPPSRGTRMIRGGDNHLAPVGPVSLARTGLLGAGGKVDLARLLTRLPRLAPNEFASTSVADWVDSLSDREAVRQIIHTLVRLTTYVNAPENLSAEVAVMQLQYALADGVLYLDRGWEQLVDHLANAAEVEIVTNSRLTDLPDAAAVVVACGGPEAASMLTGHPYPTPVAADVAVLDLGLRRPPRHDVVLGVDEPLYLSNHGVARSMTPPDGHLVSAAQYLVPGREPDREALDRIVVHAGIDADSVAEKRYLHRMPAVTAIATADQGGLVGRAPVSVPGCDGVFVVGDWVGARGHLADAVLASAEEAATAVIAHLDRRPVLH